MHQLLSSSCRSRPRWMKRNPTAGGMFKLTATRQAWLSWWRRCPTAWPTLNSRPRKSLLAYPCRSCSHSSLVATGYEAIKPVGKGQYIERHQQFFHPRSDLEPLQAFARSREAIEQAPVPCSNEPAPRPGAGPDGHS